MASYSVSADYSAITVTGPLSDPCPNTAALFDLTYTERELSAIDNFIRNCEEINVLWVRNTDLSPAFSRLLLLGYVSAIESYVRTILRDIINNDQKTKIDAYSKQVQFGAALHHKKHVLPEALLEHYAFSGEKGILGALTTFIGNKNLSALTSSLEIYEKICQLRHCCVHRFGKLGSQNGIIFGLDLHSNALEKPLLLNYTTLSEIASWLMSFAKTLNNHLFRIILDQSVVHTNPYKTDWKWMYSKDKTKFFKIYKVFATTLDSTPSPSQQELYNRFKSAKGRRTV